MNIIISIQNMQCKFCGKHKKLIKAHIIPEVFFRRLRYGKRPPELHSNKEGIYPKKSPIGVYDKGILCAECDNSIGTWDNYAQELLLKNFSEKYALYKGKLKIGYKIDDYDYKKLKLFFISVLWRASLSTHFFYKRVSAGPHEKRLHQMMMEDNPGGKNEYSVVLSKFNEPSAVEMLDPHKEKYDHVNFYRFYLSGFVFYIKVDKRSTPDFMKLLVLEKDKPLSIVIRDFHKSKDGRIIKEMINNSISRYKS